MYILTSQFPNGNSSQLFTVWKDSTSNPTLVLFDSLACFTGDSRSLSYKCHKGKFRQIALLLRHYCLKYPFQCPLRIIFLFLKITANKALTIELSNFLLLLPPYMITIHKYNDS